MKMHRILMRHCSPKDCVEVTKLFVIAESEAAILARLDSDNGYTYGAWKDRDEDGELEIHDDDYNVIGTESYSEKMLRIRGEFNDEDASYRDAYYGVTHYGWDEGIEINEDDARTIVRLGVAEDWRL